MMQEPCTVRIESLALGRRYVAKTFSRDKQEYTTKVEQALQIGNPKDAKAFARNWSEKLGVPFSVWKGERRLYTCHPH